MSSDGLPLRWAVNISSVFASLPLLDRPGAARFAGFEAIESWWPFDGPVPTSTQVSDFIRSVEDAGVDLVAMNLYGGRAGRRGVLSDPGLTQEFRSSLPSARAVGDRLGTTLFNAPYGAAVPCITPAEQDEVAVANLRRAGAVLGPDATLLLEPLSSSDGGPNTALLQTCARAVEIAERAATFGGVPRLLFDQFHVERNGLEPVVELERWWDWVAHVQVADAPGRTAPGTDGTDFDRFFTAVRRLQHSGWVALEFMPASRTDLQLDEWRERRRVWTG